MFVEVLNMSDVLTKKNDAAKLLGIAETTVQSYAQQIEKLGYKFERDIKNGYQFSDRDLKILRRVIQLRKEKVNLSEAIKTAVSDLVDMSNMVAKEDFPSTTDIADMSVIGNMLENMSNLSKTISNMSAKIDNLEHQNEGLKQAYIDQQKYLDERLEQRDGKLMESLRESQEAKKLMIEVQESLKQIAATSQKKWWQFWK